MKLHKLKVLFVLLLILGLNSCFSGGEEKNNNKNIQSTSNLNEEKEGENVDSLINTIEEDKDFSSFLNYDDSNSFYYNKESAKIPENVNNLVKYVFSQDDNLVDKFDGGLKKDIFESKAKELGVKLKKFELSLDIVDSSTTKLVKNGKVYVNNIYLGDISEGIFNKEFLWLDGVEFFNVLIRSNDYSDRFIKLNSLNSGSNFLYSEVKLKKSVFEEIDITNGMDLKYDNFTIKGDKCSIVDKKGNCFNGKVKFRNNFISGEEANNFRNNLAEMKAIDNGKVVTLQSGGMLFIDLLDNDGNYLKVDKNKKIEITYNVTKEDIENMEKFLKNGQIKNEGYWFFDKNSMIWIKKEAEYQINKDNLTWTVKTNEIY